MNHTSSGSGGFMKNFNYFARALALSVLFLNLFSMGCTKINSAENQKDPKKDYICDPFGGKGPVDAQHGIQGSIYSLSPEQPRYTSAIDYPTYGHISESILYLNDIYVPNRSWSNGFVTSNSVEIKDPSGELLIEWFGLRLQSNIRLNPENTAGKYEFALLSDDGATFKSVSVDGSKKLLVDNDGIHPDRYGCPIEGVDLDHNSSLKFELDWYQGPRYHISLILLWRPVSDKQADTNSPADPYCGYYGTNLFFDSTQVPSAPQAGWRYLMDQDWKPVPAENFYLNDTDTNPCAS